MVTVVEGFEAEKVLEIVEAEEAEEVKEVEEEKVSLPESLPLEIPAPEKEEEPAVTVAEGFEAEEVEEIEEAVEAEEVEEVRRSRRGKSQPSGVIAFGNTCS